MHSRNREKKCYTFIELAGQRLRHRKEKSVSVELSLLSYAARVSLQFDRLIGTVRQQDIAQGIPKKLRCPLDAHVSRMQPVFAVIISVLRVKPMDNFTAPQIMLGQIVARIKQSYSTVSVEFEKIQMISYSISAFLGRI